MCIYNVCGIYIYMCTYMCTYTYMYVYVCTYMYLGFLDTYITCVCTRVYLYHRS